jgi:hypothetical protein
MKTVNWLVVGLLCLSVVVHAEEVITNDTGEDATGLRFSFSSPVLITAFEDILTSIDPQMLSYEFVFSGGTVEPWGSHWFNYAPATASIMGTEWLTGSQASQIPTRCQDALPPRHVRCAKERTDEDVRWESAGAHADEQPYRSCGLRARGQVFFFGVLWYRLVPWHVH